MPRPRTEAVQGKPRYSYVTLCAMAILQSPTKLVTLSQIYDFICKNFPYYRDKNPKWQNSLRHNLSFNHCFVKVPREGGGKGNYWTLHKDAYAMYENGTLQRRKKRFKIEDEENEKIKLTSNTLEATYPDLIYAAMANSYYGDQVFQPPPPPPPPLDLTHASYMQQQLWEQQKHQQKQYGHVFHDDHCSSASNYIASEQNPAKKKNGDSPARTLVPYTIENILRPDSPKSPNSPKRKKKVYSSAENSGSGIDQHANILSVSNENLSFTYKTLEATVTPTISLTTHNSQINPASLTHRISEELSSSYHCLTNDTSSAQYLSQSQLSSALASLHTMYTPYCNPVNIVPYPDCTSLKSLPYAEPIYRNASGMPGYVHRPQPVFMG